MVADLDRRFYAGAADRMIAWGLDLLVVVLILGDRTLTVVCQG